MPWKIAFAELKSVLHEYLRAEGADEIFIRQVFAVLALDTALCPRAGKPQQFDQYFTFDAKALKGALEAMERPDTAMFKGFSQVSIAHPAGVGDILRDPDGGSWLKGDFVEHPVEQLIDVIDVVPQPLVIAS